MSTTTKTNSHWGLFVAVLFGGFVVFILACVGFASFQRFDLVEKHYYERGVAHQDQIDRSNRAAALLDAPVIQCDPAARTVTIRFPSVFVTSEVSGELILFRPSNSSYDRTVQLSLAADGSQFVDMTDSPTGMWKVKMNWQYHGQWYYQESLIVTE